MKLEEVHSTKVDTLVMLVNKLAADRRVTMVSTWGDGKPIRGIVKSLQLGGAAMNKDYSLRYFEILHNGTVDRNDDVTGGPMAELEAARLEKRTDGSYLLRLPNLEADLGRFR